MAISLTLVANRQFARRIDAGARVFPLVGLAAAGSSASPLRVR
ncbi:MULTISPECIES: hypothetical protein [Phaeobacter]|nr:MULTISPECIES: hypothetical protein [Phaeobacter]UTS81002.1 hypothetical protein OL67_002078 [Phaeobacter piscinae]